MSDFELRAGTDQDHALIYSSTTRSLWPTPYYRDVPGDQWAEMAGHLSGLTVADQVFSIFEPCVRRAQTRHHHC